MHSPKPRVSTGASIYRVTAKMDSSGQNHSQDRFEVRKVGSISTTKGRHHGVPSPFPSYSIGRKWWKKVASLFRIAGSRKRAPFFCILAPSEPFREDVVHAPSPAVHQGDVGAVGEVASPENPRSVVFGESSPKGLEDEELQSLIQLRSPISPMFRQTRLRRTWNPSPFRTAAIRRAP